MYPHLADLFHSETLALTSQNLTSAFGAILDSLPWAGAGLDWSRIPSAIHLENHDDHLFAAEVQAKTSFGQCQLAAALLSSKEPLIVGATRDLFENIDLIFLHHPGVRFVFGCKGTRSEPVPVPGAIAQYDGTEHVSFVHGLPSFQGP